MPPETPDQKARQVERWKAAIRPFGGEHVRDCLFRHNGRLYDLSAADPDVVDEILRRGHFAIDDEEPVDRA